MAKAPKLAELVQSAQAHGKRSPSKRDTPLSPQKLPKPEQALHAIQADLNASQKHWLAAGQKLRDFDDAKMWQQLGYDSMRACVVDRLQIPTTNAFRMIQNAKTYDNLPALPQPKNSGDDVSQNLGQPNDWKESHLTELSKIKDKRKLKAAASAVVSAVQSGEKLTAGLVRKCVADKLPDAEPVPKLGTPAPPYRTRQRPLGKPCGQTHRSRIGCKRHSRFGCYRHQERTRRMLTGKVFQITEGRCFYNLQESEKPIRYARIEGEKNGRLTLRFFDKDRIDDAIYNGDIHLVRDENGEPTQAVHITNGTESFLSKRPLLTVKQNLDKDPVSHPQYDYDFGSHTSYDKYTLRSLDGTVTYTAIMFGNIGHAIWERCLRREEMQSKAAAIEDINNLQYQREIEDYRRNLLQRREAFERHKAMEANRRLNFINGYGSAKRAAKREAFYNEHQIITRRYLKGLQRIGGVDDQWRCWSVPNGYLLMFTPHYESEDIKETSAEMLTADGFTSAGRICYKKTRSYYRIFDKMGKAGTYASEHMQKLAEIKEETKTDEITEIELGLRTLQNDTHTELKEMAKANRMFLERGNES